MPNRPANLSRYSPRQPVSMKPVSIRSVSVRSRHIRSVSLPLITGLAWVGGLMVGLGGIAPAVGQTATTLYNETFLNSTLTNTTGYIVGGTPNSVCLTASTQPAAYPQIGQCPAGSAGLAGGGDASGTGALRLTSNIDPSTLVPVSAGERGFFINNTAIPADQGLLIEFQFFTYNGKTFFAGSDPGGDGLSFFLIDGNASPTEPGAFGGSLGYAQRGSVNGQPPVPGLAGAYLGIGFDEFGNFSNSNEGRSGPPGVTALQPDSIALRGPANPNDPTRFTGYDFIASAKPGPSIDSTASINTPANSRTDAQVTPRTARITLTAAGDLTVEVDFTGTGTSFTPLPTLSRNIRTLNPNVPFPTAFKFGFAASTGTSTAIHEVRNVKITTVPPPAPPPPPPPPPPIPVVQQLRLVKRVTAITRSGVRTAFDQFVDDPGDANDTLAGWAQLTGGLVGVPTVSATNRLQTADDIEYTVYYLAEGNTTLLAPTICDAIPAKTTLVPNSLQISQNNSALVTGGTAFSRLQPLPATASACADQTNANGSVLFDLGNLPVTNSTNRPPTPTVSFVGAVRFKTRIN